MTRRTTRKATTRPAPKLKSPKPRRSASGRRAPSKGDGTAMTVREAGRLGGLIGGRKGGLTVKAERGVGFYQEIGRMGGQRVRDLIAAGRKATERSRGAGARRRHT